MKIALLTNFKFGFNRKGNIDTLKKFEKLYNYKIIITKLHKKNNKIISSSQIRKKIKIGKIEEANKLYEAIKEDYADEKSKYKQYLAIKKNKYFNALQIKFSYAITCHKSQGGQWENVFIEQPYLPDGVSEPYYRWLYTAITRAKQRLFLIGFKDEYFKD